MTSRLDSEGEAKGLVLTSDFSGAVFGVSEDSEEAEVRADAGL